MMMLCLPRIDTTLNMFIMCWIGKNMLLKLSLLLFFLNWE